MNLVLTCAMTLMTQVKHGELLETVLFFLLMHVLFFSSIYIIINAIVFVHLGTLS